MPLRDLKLYGDFLAKNQQQQAIENKKLDQENQKIHLEKLKIVQDQAQKDLKVKEIETGNISKELDNKEKKIGLWERLTDILSGRAERDSATEDARQKLSQVRTASPDSIQKQLATLPEPPPPPPPSLQAPDTAPPPDMVVEPEPLPPPPELVPPPGPMVVPAPPFVDVQPTQEALDQEAERIRAGIAQREMLLKRQEAVNSSFIQSLRQTQQRMSDNMALQKSLSEDPPTYRKALANVHWSQELVGILDASLNGHLYENPMQYLDNIVNKELADQMSRYKAQKGYLASEASMYQQFYNMNKDEVEAQHSTLALLYKGEQDQVKSYARLVKNAEQRTALENLNKELQYKHDIEIGKLEAHAQQKGVDNAIKMAKLAIETQELQEKKEARLQKNQQQAALQVPGVPFGLSPKDVIDRRIPFGGKDYYDMPKNILEGKEGVRQAVRNNVKSVQNVKGLEKEAKKLSTSKFFASYTTWVPFSSMGEEARRTFDRVNKGLTELKLKFRIQFTGGGNISQGEHAMMDKYFEVKDGRWVFKGTQQRLAQLIAKGKGEYDTLFKILKKVSFFNTLTDMDQSPTFKNQSRVQKFKAVQKELGLSDKDIKDFIKNVDYGGGT